MNITSQTTHARIDKPSLSNRGRAARKLAVVLATTAFALPLLTTPNASAVEVPVRGLVTVSQGAGFTGGVGANFVPGTVGTAEGAGFGFLPSRLITTEGAGAELSNFDSIFTHRIQSDDVDAEDFPLFDSDETFLQVNEIVGVESLEPGSYNFHCTHHAVMTGTITVLPTGQDSN